MIFFITGGSRGIGAQLVCDVLAAGHDAAFTYVTNEAEARAVVAWAEQNAPERGCRAYRMDQRESVAVEKAANCVLDDFGDVDVVVLNAGMVQQGLIVAMSDADWQQVIDVNLSGAFYVARQFLPHFLAKRRGRFIHMSSVAQNGMSGLTAYSASKAGLCGLSAGLAKEYGRKGITSNVLMLGFFDTDMTRDMMPDQQKEFWSRFCPAGRLGVLSEVSEAVLYLASDGAGFVNGTTIPLTGGQDWVP